MLFRSGTFGRVAAGRFLVGAIGTDAFAVVLVLEGTGRRVELLEVAVEQGRRVGFIGCFTG